jgi:Ca2+:H+ antiporter
MKLSPEFQSRYEIDLSNVVSGRVGSVFRATDRSTGKSVAVKVFEAPPPMADGGAVDKFLGFVRKAMELDHGNLVRVRDCGKTADGMIYVVTDWIGGESLRERRGSRGRMDVPDALAAAQGILQGLSQIHSKGFVHGNLKMENVRLDENGRPIVADFATGFLRHDTKNRLPPNPASVAPELIQTGAPPSVQSDLYAVGTILYELLTGAAPFEGSDLMDVLNRHLEVAPVMPSARAEDVSEQVDALVLQALRKDPTKRFQSADEMLKAVQAALGVMPKPPLLPGGKLNVLLVFMPIALIAHLGHFSDVLTFVAACLAIIPMASILGEATEHLAEQVGPSLGGFLNATFGNATEILIAMFGIWKGGTLIDTVKASLTGSILGNLLFILGLSMLMGGLKREKQTFNRTAIGVGNSLMILAVSGLLIPSIVHAILRADPHLKDLDVKTTNSLSLAVAVILLITYFLSLLFSLKTHRHLSAGVPEVEPSEHEMTHLMPKKKALMLLAGATLFISILSEALVASVEATGHALGISPLFMGLVVIAMVGNAAEHATAVMVAMKDKMDLACNIAMGSSVQVALFLAPLLVVVSHMIGKPMDLVFSPMEVIAVMLAVCVTISVNIDGESTWIEGALLLAVYAILAAAFWFMPVGPGESHLPKPTHGALVRPVRAAA